MKTYLSNKPVEVLDPEETHDILRPDFDIHGDVIINK